MQLRQPAWECWETSRLRGQCQLSVSQARVPCQLSLLQRYPMPHQLAAHCQLSLPSGGTRQLSPPSGTPCHLACHLAPALPSVQSASPAFKPPVSWLCSLHSSSSLPKYLSTFTTTLCPCRRLCKATFHHNRLWAPAPHPLRPDPSILAQPAWRQRLRLTSLWSSG